MRRRREGKWMSKARGRALEAVEREREVFGWFGGAYGM